MESRPEGSAITHTELCAHFEAKDHLPTKSHTGHRSQFRDDPALIPEIIYERERRSVQRQMCEITIISRHGRASSTLVGANFPTFLHSRQLWD